MKDRNRRIVRVIIIATVVTVIVFSLLYSIMIAKNGESLRYIQTVPDCNCNCDCLDCECRR